MRADLGEPHPSVGDDLVERAHQLVLGDDGELLERSALETAVQPRVEWRARDRVLAQHAERLALVPFEALPRPAIAAREDRAPAEHPSQQERVPGSVTYPRGRVRPRAREPGVVASCGAYVENGEEGGRSP